MVSNQPKADDSRLSVFLDINAIKGLIESWETKCAKLLKPESKEDKEMAMKIKRQVAVPGRWKNIFITSVYIVSNIYNGFL